MRQRIAFIASHFPLRVPVIASRPSLVIASRRRSNLADCHGLFGPRNDGEAGGGPRNDRRVNTGTRIAGLMKLAVLALFLCAAGMTAAAEDAPVGEVSFVIGTAKIVAGPDAPQDIVRGAKVRAGQTLETGNNGHIHLRFVDGGSVAVRPQSRLRIDEYRYDPANPRENRVKFSLQQGTMRSITGSAGEAAKDRFRLNTPIAAIGIKGTDFIVRADNDATRVAVNRGAIIMAPLGGACSAEALGPCNIANARELTAAMADRYLELKVRSAFPEILQIDQGSPFIERNGATAPDDSRAIRNRRSSTPAGDVTPIIAEASASASLVLASAMPPPSPPLPTPPPPPPPQPPPVPLPTIAVVPQIWWGRWAPGADPAVSYATQMAVAGREYAAGNELFGLLRENVAVSRLPGAGHINFTLAQSEVYLVQGQQLTPAFVSGASLGINFDAQRFNTQLSVVPPGMKELTLSSQGGLQGDGRFISDRGQAMWVFGSLSLPSAQQAGYAFQLPLSASQSLSGVTLWTH